MAVQNNLESASNTPQGAGLAAATPNAHLAQVNDPHLEQMFGMVAPEEDNTPNLNAQAGGAPAPSPAPNEVELEINGEAVKVTLDELKKGYLRQSDYTRKSQENARLIERGQTYVDGLAALEASPENAVKIIDSWIESAFQAHGEALTPHLKTLIETTIAPELEGVDLNSMSDETRAVYQTSQRENRRLKSEIDDLKTVVSELIDVNKGLIQTNRANSLLPVEVDKVKAEIPSAANLTPETLAKMKADTGESDPIKAYKLATYGAAVEQSYQQGQQNGRSAFVMPTAGAGGGAEELDMKPGETAEEFVQRMRGLQNRNQ